MNRIKTKTILIIITMVINFNLSHAGGGGSRIVYDPWNWTQNSNNTLKTILQLSTDLQNSQDDLVKIQQLYELLEYNELNTTPLNQIYNNRVKTLEGQFNRAGELSYDVKSLNNEFDTLYPDWKDNEGLTADDYDYYTTEWEKNTINTVKDSVKGQAIQPIIKDGRMNLDKLLITNANATGQLEALQVANQISGILAEQLILLNEMSSKHFRAQDVKLLDDLNSQHEGRAYDREVEKATRRAHKQKLESIKARKKN